MGEKVNVSREVANAMERWLKNLHALMKISEEDAKAKFVAHHQHYDAIKMSWQDDGNGKYAALDNITPFELMKALVNGYEVEGVNE